MTTAGTEITEVASVGSPTLWTVTIALVLLGLTLTSAPARNASHGSWHVMPP